MIISPKTITTDAMERLRIRKGLELLIALETKRLKTLKKETSIDAAEWSIAYAQDLLVKFADTHGLT